jgi:hypothetical protein
MLKEYNIKNIYQGRLYTGDDLLKELTSIVKEKGIKVGKISAIGAVQRAKISYYNQDEQVYQAKEFEKHLEIVNLLGNISIKDEEVMIHAHISLGDDEGNLFGGHLAEGTMVFACEFIIEEYQGEPLERVYDETTGLTLWNE